MRGIPDFELEEDSHNKECAKCGYRLGEHLVGVKGPICPTEPEMMICPKASECRVCVIGHNTPHEYCLTCSTGVVFPPCPRCIPYKERMVDIHKLCCELVNAASGGMTLTYIAPLQLPLSRLQAIIKEYT